MKIGLTLFSLVIILIFISCTSHNSNTNLNDNKDTLKKSWGVSYWDTVSANTVDTSQYAKIPYRDSSYSFGSVFIDTFSENGTKFRIVNPVASHRNGENYLRLQQSINGKWIITALKMSDNIHGGHFSHSIDINQDGFNDITNETRFTQDVYFYNPRTKTFNDTSSANINPNWIIIDTEKNIFCDFQEFKGMSGQIHSGLYTFHGFEQYYLYNLELDNNEDQEKITGLILNKCINGSTDNVVQVEKTKFKNAIDLTVTYDNYFDFKNYWLKRYKKLLAYR